MNYTNLRQIIDMLTRFNVFTQDQANALYGLIDAMVDVLGAFGYGLTKQDEG